MNIDKAKILLEKINVLMRSMSVSPDQIADIEQDLMKNYIRQLYESVLEESAPAPKSAPTPKPVKKEIVPPPTPEPAPEPEPIPEPAPVKAAPAPKPKPTPTPPPPPPPAPEPEVEMEVVAPVPAPTPKPVVKPSSISSDLEEIFTHHTATDLGEKLSQSPIKDLTKAFSINERMFTIKELFGDNNDLFNKTIKQLDGLKSFEEAKNLLVNSVASEYGWSKKSKQNKAKEFVKLIKRRYN